MKILTIAVLAATALTSQAFAQTQPTPPVGPDFSKIEVKTFDLGRNTYMLEGAGGNVTVAVGDDAIIMVDGQFAPMHDKLKAAIEAQSKLPIRYLINTHYHGDHTGGNEGFSKIGVTVVAHPFVGKILGEGFTNGLTGAKTPPRPAEALPKLTYDGGAMALEIKGRVAQLKHPAAAHTGGDTWVFFADANVLSTGDTVTIGRYPNIDFANGGNIKGMIEASDAYLAATNDGSKIVPGHGPLATRAQLAEYRAMLATARDRMAKLIEDGKTEQEVLALKPFADLDAKWAPTEQASTNFMRVVYNSLKK
ncbi:MAG TPA: MBL fold metallo-hydrolase [Pseudorhodoplanes sp.]|nr:MBL fold metallo-hydrolase [Pseudorhodoplanes sp.]